MAIKLITKIKRNLVIGQTLSMLLINAFSSSNLEGWIVAL